jgi:hypothetical protein
MIGTLITPKNFRYKASCKICPTVFVCDWEDFQNKYAGNKGVAPCYIVNCPTCGSNVNVKDCELFQKVKNKDGTEIVDIVQSL